MEMVTANLNRSMQGYIGLYRVIENRGYRGLCTVGLHRGYIHKSYTAPKPLKPPNPQTLKH